jgi:arylsulfatase A-like enzyme
MEQCAIGVVRDDRFKYVQFAAPPEVLPPLLFDLEADPDQVHDLAADPGHAAVVAEYAQRMLRWRMAHLERTLTGTFLTDDGPVVRRDPRV